MLVFKINQQIGFNFINIYKLSYFLFFMIIVISGSVGSGKTTISNYLAKKLNFKLINLNEFAKNFKIEDVKELQTFDFDIGKLILNIEKKIKIWKKNNENIIIESHFAHDINPNLVDKLIIISRPLNLLKKEYIKREYNDIKIKENLEVESFNLCFYEAIENGYGENFDLFNKDEIKENLNIKLFENNSTLEKICKDIEDFILEKL